MVKVNTLKKALRRAESIMIREIPDTEIKTAKSAAYDAKTKGFSFYDEKCNVIVKFSRYDIRTISRILTDDNVYKFLISLKNDVDYEMEFIMQKGFSFLGPDTAIKENIETVVKVIPKYLSGFSGKRVIVKKNSYNEAFSVWNVEYDLEDSVVTENFVINDFDYEVKALSGLAVVSLIDKSNSNTYAQALDVMCISGNSDNCVILGCRSGNYCLKRAE